MKLSFDSMVTKEPIRLAIIMENVIFDTRDEYSELHTESTMKKKYHEDLKPIPGAIEAFKNLNSITDLRNRKIFDVNIISTLSLTNQKSYINKIANVQKWFGDEALKKLIFCQDKSSIRTDILIDNSFKTQNFLNTNKLTLNTPYIQIRYGIDETNFYQIKSWTDSDYLDVIKKTCIDLGLLVI